MTSILGAVLTTHYASAIAGQSVSNQVSSATEAQLQLSFASAENIAAHASPQDADAIISAAKSSFLDGDRWAYGAGLLSVVVGAALVFLVFPRREREDELHAAYRAVDEATQKKAAPEPEGGLPEPASV